MALFHLIYMSSLVAGDANALPAILEVAVRNNKQRNITGMLLYSDGNLMQVLEGEKDVVLKTFRAIEQDSRHRGCVNLHQDEIASRDFASWSMGFRHITKADFARLPVAEHVFKAGQDTIALRSRAGDALTVLKAFAGN